MTRFGIDPEIEPTVGRAAQVPTAPTHEIERKLKLSAIESMRAHLFLWSLLLLGCATGGDLVNMGDNAWRLTTIANTDAEVARVGTSQAVALCGKQGKVPLYSAVRTTNDMPARYISTMEFICTAGGTSPEALAEARMHGYQRDCAISGFELGSPENRKCAADLSAKFNSKSATGR
jgi:hypothetical protein